MPAYYAIGLLIAFYALAIAEMLIPSGGILGLSAAVVAVTSIIIGYSYSSSMGLTLTLIYVVTTPALLILLIRLWPKTKIGRRMLNRDTLESDSTLPEATTIDGTPLSEFVGCIGTATSNLLPSGEVKVDGHRCTAVSTGMPIDTGTFVVVVRIHTGKLHVRQANEDEIQQWRQQTEPTLTATSVPSSAPEPPPLEAAPPHEVPPQPDPTDSVVTSPLDDIDFDQLTMDPSRDDESV